jgi:hypothetical protein
MRLFAAAVSSVFKLKGCLLLGHMHRWATAQGHLAQVTKQQALTESRHNHLISKAIAYWFKLGKNCKDHSNTYGMQARAQWLQHNCVSGGACCFFI